MAILRVICLYDCSNCNTIKKDPQTAQKFNSRFLRSSFILASDTIVGKFTAIVVETVTFVANVGYC